MLLCQAGTLLCQLGCYFVSWDTTLSAGTLLCQLGRYSVSWDATLSAGTLLCQLGRYSVSWDTTLSAGTLLCRLGRYSVGWDATLSECGILFNGQFSTVNAMYITFISRFTIIKLFNTIFHNSASPLRPFTW
jgi:hypothetical protein